MYCWPLSQSLYKPGLRTEMQLSFDVLVQRTLNLLPPVISRERGRGEAATQQKRLGK